MDQPTNTLHRQTISGVMPHLTISSDLGPPRSECGTGAMVAWADRLWVVTYLSHTGRTGSGTGLYEIDAHFTMTQRPESVAGTYANRMIHVPSNQLIIGPHIISAERSVRTFDALTEHRLCATMEHLSEPESKVYFLTMEGLFFEADVETLGVKMMFDLTEELSLADQGQLGMNPDRGGALVQPHFKAAHTAQGRVIVSNNTYDDNDFAGRKAGRLAEWDGESWRVIERTSFIDIHGRRNLGEVVFATGYDRASAILKVLVEGEWYTYRLPKASQTYEHFWQTEWPRIREVEHERFLMDCHGMFYELSPVALGGRIFGVKPICAHLRVVPDFCSFKGLLALGGNQVTPTMDKGQLLGEAQANFWFGNIDELWNWGKPSGWGGVWWEDPVKAGAPSDPYLMTGFEHKVLHLYHNAPSTVSFTVEVDFLGNGTWKVYKHIEVKADGYEHHVFPLGFGAHWVRLRADTDAICTAYLVYS